MPFSDRDMLVATQVAYYDFDLDILESNHYNATLRELFEQDPGVYEKLKATLENKDNSPAEQYRAQEAMKLYEEIMEEGSPYGDWVIKAVKDDNSNSGFYGCVIEASPDEAILGFRGSESMDGNQMVKDWALADFGLLNSEQTWQQQAAEEFMREVNEKYDYDVYYTSGHSLGGNLSNHAAITAPKEMKEKIVQSYSFDGPGFSDEYLDKNREAIEECQGKLTHYKWSIIGNLLFQPSAARDQEIALKDNPVEGEGEYLFQRHDVSFVDFDKNGHVKEGKADIPETLSSNISKILEMGAFIVPLLLIPGARGIAGILKMIPELLEYLNGEGKKTESSMLTGGEQGTCGDGSFLADCFRMEQLFEKLENCKNQMLSIALEVSEIRQSLTFSGSQKKIRAALKKQEKELESLGESLGSLRQKGEEICRCYEETEDRVLSVCQRAEIA